MSCGLVFKHGINRLMKLLGIKLTIKDWKRLRIVSIAYVIVVFSLFIASMFILEFVEDGTKQMDFVGCYAYDAMLVGFDCSGFFGAQALGLALNYPLYHLYMPFFVLFNPILILALLAMWFFPVMLYVSTVKLRKLNA